MKNVCRMIRIIFQMPTHLFKITDIFNKLTFLNCLNKMDSQLQKNKENKIGFFLRFLELLKFLLLFEQSEMQYELITQ